MAHLDFLTMIRSDDEVAMIMVLVRQGYWAVAMS